MSEDIAPIIRDVEQALAASPREASIIAIISMTLILTYPELTQEQLRHGVQEVSRFICMVLDDTTDLDPRMVN